MLRFLLSAPPARGILGRPAAAMPGENEEGSLRPETRVKPRSLAGDCDPVSITGRWLWRNMIGIAPIKGVRPARSAMPGACDVGGSGETVAVPGRLCIGLRPRYQRRNSMAMRRRAARPATPPTTPPARTDAGGVLLLESLVVAAVVVEELDDAVELAEPAPPTPAVVPLAVDAAEVMPVNDEVSPLNEVALSEMTVTEPSERVDRCGPVVAAAEKGGIVETMPSGKVVT